MSEYEHCHDDGTVHDHAWRGEPHVHEWMTLTTGPVVECVEASDLGLAPGYWPTTIEFNGAMFNKSLVQHNPNGDVGFVVYLTDDGRKLEVLND